MLFEISLIHKGKAFVFPGSLLRFYLNFCFLDDPDPDDGFNYKQMMVRDERRFKMADKDGDLIATKEEFTAFLHPEEYDYMKDIVVQVGKTKVPNSNSASPAVTYALFRQTFHLP